MEDLKRTVQEEGPNLVVFAGNVLASGSRPPETATHALHRALHTLATLPCAVALVSGELDAPERHVLPIEAAQEWSERHLYCVHGMFMTAGDLGVAGSAAASPRANARPRRRCTIPVGRSCTGWPS